MATWLRNFNLALENKEVVILHGNVRDKYISRDSGLVYNNLTELLQFTAHELPIKFARIVFFDPVGKERGGKNVNQPAGHPASGEELPQTAPGGNLAESKTSPTRILSKWEKESNLGTESFFATIFYLDKLVSYKTTYQPDERELILRLEKLIENIGPQNRLVLVALQDTMVPVELYTNSPKVALVNITRPDKEDRVEYLRNRLGDAFQHLDLVGNLTDGLFLRELDSMAAVLNKNANADSREIRRLVNRYRLGEQQDYWGKLDIEKLNSAPAWFIDKEGVKGQDEAVKKVTEVMALARAGLSGMASGASSKPKGVLFFAGPTGVGKTFLAKKLAKFLFGSEEAFIRFDMSEFKEEHTDSKLIGSPPGYVGYERGGMLTGAVRDKPFSVILFDEIEKAHPKIMDMFLQVLDEGRLTDSRGQTVFFTETVIIFTSNIGTRTQDSRGGALHERADIDAIIRDANLSEEKRRQKIHAHFVQAVRDFFMYEISRPELLNRIGNNIVAFNYIDSAEIQKDIVRAHFKRIKDDFEDKFRSQENTVEFDDPVIDYLVAKHAENVASFGGRAITNAIEDEIIMLLSRASLKAEFNHARGIQFRLKMENGAPVVEENARVAGWVRQV